MELIPTIYKRQGLIYTGWYRKNTKTGALFKIKNTISSLANILLF
jgi:hypothetical protein